MKVTTLETVKNDPFISETVKFHFCNGEIADKFLFVFKDHWCHVDFNKYEEELEFTNGLKEELAKDPKDYAEKNLNWGFNFARFNGDDKITTDEQNFINHLVKVNNTKH